MYDIILADPPWHYNNRGFDDRMRGGCLKYYKTMKTPELCKLPVSQLANENALLFLWATGPCMTDAFQVIESWGFEFKTFGFVWVKTNKGKKGQWVNLYELMGNTPDELKANPIFASGGFFFGNGYYTKANAEICLLAKRGKVGNQFKPATDAVSNLIVAPVRAHSQKPWETHHRIEAMYPGMKKLEMFARDKRPGWDVWGNQVDCDIDLEVKA